MCYPDKVFMEKLNRRSCVIVIPIHCAIPSQNELISFKQCFKILHNHPIKVIAPRDLDLSHYIKVVPNFEVIYIDPIWQSSIRQYNRLKISSFFYELFNGFDFLLTYELDAFVFQDNLDYWCKQGYDYIGAPWFEGWDKANKTAKIIGVGNGGFSLRNIASSLRAIKKRNTLKKLQIIWHNCFAQKIIPFATAALLFKKHFKIQNMEYLNDIFDSSKNEDYYWTQIIANFFNNYKVAPIKDAIKFSSDTNPSILFEMNNYKLPFGCHAWGRYEPEFWNKFIK